MQEEAFNMIRAAERLEDLLTRDLNKFMNHPDPEVGAWFVQMIKARNHLRNSAKFSSSVIKALE